MNKNRVCANGGVMSRRALMTSISASPLALSFASPVAARASDPLIAMHERWIALRRKWDELAKVPGNESLATPPMTELQDQWIALEEQMADCIPSSIEGVAALVSLSWYYLTMEDNGEHAERRALRSVWQACTGEAGDPLV